MKGNVQESEVRSRGKGRDIPVPHVGIATPTLVLAEKENGVSRIESGPEGDLRLELVGLVRVPPGYQGEVHSHPFWELFYIGAGNGLIERDGQCLPFGAESLHLVRPAERHAIRAGVSGSLEMLYLGFNFHVHPDSFSLGDAPGDLPQGPAADLIRSDLREIHAGLRNSEQKDIFRRTGVRFLPIVSRVVESIVSARKDAGDGSRTGPHHSLVQRIKGFLSANLGGKLSVPDMARHFHLSPQYFGEVFKRGSGMSIKEYHRFARLQKAMELLRTTEMSIKAIAWEVGMEDVAYFSRSFKAKFGYSPRQARTQLRGD
jgi:AraC-like DNA-binding protein/mannose-6-phosphate isomerase-like protein (cupin superfamily)